MKRAKFTERQIAFALQQAESGVLAWRADYYALLLCASWGVLFIQRAEACV
jgi:hypothetical protein